MKADMPWQLPIESGACKYVKPCGKKKKANMIISNLTGLYYLIMEASQMKMEFAHACIFALESDVRMRKNIMVGLNS